MKQIKVYLSIQDYKKIKSEAVQKSISVAEVVRQKMDLKIQNPPVPKRPKRIYKDVDPKLLYELNNIIIIMTHIAKKLSEQNSNEVPNNLLIFTKFVNIEKQLASLL